jgi:hypothetical protein
MLMTSATPARGGSGGAVLRVADEVAASVLAAVDLREGEVFEGGFYELSADGLVVEASPDVAGVSEVRVGLAFRNTTDIAIPSWTPAINAVGFPAVVLRDARGTTYAPDVTHPGRALVAGSDVTGIEPGMSVRWTVGFQLPTERVDDLTIVAIDGGVATAQWTFDDEVDTFVALDTPRLPVVSLGDTIDYEPGVAVTPRGIGAMVCGDPEIEPIAHLFTVAFDVRNDTLDQVRWPADIYAGPAPVVQWRDGASAEMSLETFWGDAETLPRVSGHAVLLPPVASASRALVFSAPRDGRFADIDALPEGIRLPTAGGDVWLELSGIDPTIGIDPAMCDLGGFGAPVPFAYGPGQKFQVAGEEQPLPRADQDAAAEALITRARSAVSIYFDANNQTLRSFDEDAFLAVAPTLDIIEVNAGVSRPLGAVDEIYFDIDSSRPAFVFIATRSESGTWFCSGGDVFRIPATASGPSLAEIGPTCFPSAFAASS